MVRMWMAVLLTLVFLMVFAFNYEVPQYVKPNKTQVEDMGIWKDK
jgi:hypothetical protein